LKAYWPEFEAGAVAEASLDAALAAIAVEFDDMELVEEAIAALASEAPAVLVVSAGLLQAATERAARAAPTIRMERSVPEVMFQVPVEEVSAPIPTLSRNMTRSRSCARESSRPRDHF
jgi:hypothetical protein